MAFALLIAAAILLALAVLYGLLLLNRREGATGAWLFLIGAMLSMLTWRVAMLTGIEPPPFFNPVIGIWGSSCMLGAMFLFSREVAARRLAETLRDTLLEKERAARGEAELANRVKDDFLATLSHELRSPLAAILGWCTVLRRSAARREDVDRALDVIERNARAQERLIEDLLDVTRLQAGTLQLDLEAIALDVPVRAAMLTVGPQAEARGVTLTLEDNAVKPVVRADSQRLQQVVGNLVGNAIKFTPPGGQVALRIFAADDQACLTIRDTGEGIDPEFLPHVFGRFRQSDRTPTRRHGGLGLGLAIVEQLVALHGGKVTASSAGPGMGATFTVSLPLATASDSAASGAVARGAARGDDAPLAGMTVVVVDDEPDVRSAISQMLEQSGARVFAFASGEQIEAAMVEHRPDLLLIDIGMPFEDGYSVIRRVRQLPAARGGRTPAISLTAHARNEDRARALAAGFDQHLPKPIDIAVLVSAVLAQTPPAPAATGTISARA